MFAGIIPLLIIGLLVWGGISLAKRVGPSSTGSGLRHIVTSLFTLATAIIASVGVGQLLELAFESGDAIAGRNATSVARAIALTAVGLPSFGVLWRYLTRIVKESQTAHLVWGLYLGLATAVFAIGAVIGLGTGLIWAFGWANSGAGALGIGISWMLMWVWHEWHRVSVLPPTTLGEIAPSIGSTIGLFTLGTGAAMMLVALLERAYAAITDLPVATTSLGERAGEAAVWLVIGGGVWWWQWLHDAARRPESIARSAYVLLPGSATGAVATAAGTGALLYTILEYAFGEGASTAARQFEVLPGIITAIGLGFLVWRYHRGVAMRSVESEAEVGYAYRYILSGLGLIAAATGLGIIVNGLLAAATPAVAGEGGTRLILGGLSALVVGGPVWWLTWFPRREPSLDEAGSKARRSYLTVLAGVGGVSALVSLITTLYRMLESVFEGDSFVTLVDRSRAPFGVLAATGLVAAYHIVTWRRERHLLPEKEHVAVRKVTVVTTHPENGLKSLGHDLGVSVVTLHSGGAGRVVGETELAEYLRTLEADEAVVIEEERGYRVIRVTDD